MIIFFGTGVMLLGIFFCIGLYALLCGNGNCTTGGIEADLAREPREMPGRYLGQLYSEDEMRRRENEPTPWRLREWPSGVTSSPVVTPPAYSEGVPAYEEVVKKDVDLGMGDGELPPSYSEVAMERF